MAATSQPSRIFAGGLMIIGGMSAIGLVDNFVRYIEQEAGLWQFHLFRAVFCAVLVLIYCAFSKQSLKPKRLWAVALRGFLMAWAILIYFGALSLMPIAEAGATLFSSPIFMLVFSVIIFRVKIGIWRVLAVLVGFAGVLLVLKPSPQNLGFFAMLPLLAGVFYAIGQLVTRHLCAEETTVSVMMFFFFLIGFFSLIGMIILHFFPAPQEWVQAAPFFLRGWEHPTGEFLFWVLVQAVGSVLGIAGLIRGYQIAEPTYVSVFEYSFLLFAGFWGWVLWNEIPDSLAIVGIVAIIVAGVVITLRSRTHPE